MTSMQVTVGAPDQGNTTTEAALEASQKVKVGGHDDARNVNVPTPHGPVPEASPHTTYVDSDGNDVAIVTKLNSPPLVTVKGNEIPLSTAVQMGLVKAGTANPPKGEPQPQKTEADKAQPNEESPIDEGEIDFTDASSHEYAAATAENFVATINDSMSEEDLAFLSEMGIDAEGLAEGFCDDVNASTSQEDIDNLMADVSGIIGDEAAIQVYQYVSDAGTRAAMKLGKAYQMSEEQVSAYGEADEAGFARAAVALVRGDCGEAMSQWLAKGKRR